MLLTSTLADRQLILARALKERSAWLRDSRRRTWKINSLARKERVYAALALRAKIALFRHYLETIQ